MFLTVLLVVLFDLAVTWSYSYEPALNLELLDICPVPAEFLGSLYLWLTWDFIASWAGVISSSFKAFYIFGMLAFVPLVGF